MAFFSDFFLRGRTYNCMPARCDADADNFDERLVLNSRCQARCKDQSKDSKYLFSTLAWPPVCGKAVEEYAGPGGGEIINI